MQGEDLSGPAVLRFVPSARQPPHTLAQVYGILTAQLVLTTLVALCISSSPAAVLFFLSHPSVQLLSFAAPLFLLIPLYAYRQSHPTNLALLAAWTLGLAGSVGVTVSLYPAGIVLQALVLTAATVCGLTAYTFWAVRRGVEFGCVLRAPPRARKPYRRAALQAATFRRPTTATFFAQKLTLLFSFLGPFLSSMLWGLIAFSCLAFFVPVGGVGQLAMAAFGACLFSAYIVFDTFALIKRFSIDDYVWASVTLYLDSKPLQGSR